MPGKRIRLRAGVSRGAIGVDKENHILKGFSVISLGEAKGHNLEIDKTTLQQVVEKGNSHKGGVKMRFGHPNMSTPATGTFVGRAKDFKLSEDGTRVRADGHISPTALKEPPNGGGRPLGEYIEHLGETDPDMFGASIVFAGESETRLDDNGNELMPLARVDELLAADVVDEPATGDAMFQYFSETVKPSAEMTEFLDEFFQQEGALDKMDQFFHKYLDNEKYKALRKKAKETFNIDKNRKLLFTLQEADNMPIEKPDESTTSEAIIKEREELAVKQALERVAAIQTGCEKLGLKKEIADKMISDKLSLEQAQAKMIEESAKLRNNIDSIVPGADGQEKMREGMTNAILMRANIEKDPKVISDVRKSEFNGMGIKALALHCLHNAGAVNVHMMNPSQIHNSLQQYQMFDANQGSGDFVNVISNVLNKSVAKGWEGAKETYEIWTGTGTLSDFKTADLVRLSAMGDVKEIHEGEAPEQANMADKKEQTRLKTFGQKYVITRQLIANDDLSQFTTVPAKQMSALKRSINRRVYQYMYDDNGAGTAFLGPTMNEDSVRLFDASSHDNYATSGSGPTKALLETIFLSFRNKTDFTPDNDRSGAVRLNITPNYFISGGKHEADAYELFESLQYSVSGEATTSMYRQGQRRNLQVVIDAEIDALSTTYYPWYAAISPNDGDTVTIYTLNGNSAPYTDSRQSFVGDARGMIWVIEFDYAIGLPDWRGLYCDRGTAK